MPATGPPGASPELVIVPVDRLVTDPLTSSAMPRLMAPMLPAFTTEADVPPWINTLS